VHSSPHSARHRFHEPELWPSVAEASEELGLRERLASLREQLEMTMEGPEPNARAYLENPWRDGDSTPERGLH
jgi:hypothetical protein